MIAMDSAIFQHDPQISTFGDHDWKLLDNSSLVDPGLNIENMDSFSPQSSDPLAGEFDTFVDTVDWQTFGDAHVNAQQPVLFGEGAQGLHNHDTEGGISPALATPVTFIKTEASRSTIINEVSADFENPGFDSSFQFNYPDPLETAITVQKPYFNSPQFLNASEAYNAASDTAVTFTPGLDFGNFQLLDPSLSAPVNSPKDASYYGAPNPIACDPDQIPTLSPIQNSATISNYGQTLALPYAGHEDYQEFQHLPNTFLTLYSTPTLGQQVHDTSWNDSSYAIPARFVHSGPSISPPLSQYSPHPHPLRLCHADPGSPSPNHDVDSGSAYSEEEESHPKKPARRRFDSRKTSKEKPKIPKDKPWIRINKETRGGTSRTLKINNYNPDEIYEQLTHPIGAWSAGHSKREFVYSAHHELGEREMSIGRLKQFIQCHPKTDDCKLTLYIQRTPADSKRRYGSDQTERCRCADCPARVYGKSVASRGLITPGNYRVAFDEFSYGYGTYKGSRADPFKVAFFVHLYCLERFLDFPALCRLENVSVEADNRQAMPNEPNAKFGAALSGIELKIAASFIDACRAGNLRSPNGEWTNYPLHTKIGAEIKWKDHYDTLNYRLQNGKNTIRSSKVQRQGKLTNIAVHCGNLDVVHKAMKEIYKTPKDVPGWRYTDRHGKFTGPRNDPPQGWVLDPIEPPPRSMQKRQVEEIEGDKDYNEHNKKMARTGESLYDSVNSTCHSGMDDGSSTRQDMFMAYYTPTTYSA